MFCFSWDVAGTAILSFFSLPKCSLKEEFYASYLFGNCFKDQDQGSVPVIQLAFYLVFNKARLTFICAFLFPGAPPVSTEILMKLRRGG